MVTCLKWYTLNGESCNRGVKSADLAGTGKNDRCTVSLGVWLRQKGNQLAGNGQVRENGVRVQMGVA